MKKNNRTKRLFFLVISIVLCFSVSGISAFASELSDSQKDDYYAQYLQIIKEVNALKLGSEVSVAPKDQIAEEDWITPEEFRVLAENMAQTVVVDDMSGISPFSVMSASRTTTVKNGSATATIRISGTFTTQYSSLRDRQVIQSVSSISSSKSLGVGTWTHTGSEHSIGDGGRTCTIYVSGRYTVGSVSADIVASTEFYCTAEGNVR